MNTSISRPIFLSYRRTDSANATSRLYDALRNRFGPDRVFMDLASTAWGDEWRTVLDAAVDAAAFVVVVIGPRWLFAQDGWGRRSSDQPDDWVRHELEVALTHGKSVLPLLVDGAEMPPREALPDAIAPLTEKQARHARDESWDADIEALLQALGERVSTAGPETSSAHRSTIEDEFRSVAARFYTGGLGERNAAAGEIAALGSLLDLDTVLRLVDSRQAGERVGAAIALAAHLRTSEALRADPRVQSALRGLLNDTRERVRYRAAEVLKSFPALASAYKQDLTWLTRPEENWQVRRMAEDALNRAGL